MSSFVPISYNGRCLFIILLEQFYILVQIGFIEISFLGLEMWDKSDLPELAIDGCSTLSSLSGKYCQYLVHLWDVFLDIHFNRNDIE